MATKTKNTPKKSEAKKPTAKKSEAKKSVAKKLAAKKPAAKKPAAKKPAPKKPTPKKPAATKPAAKKPAAKKPAAKAAPKKAAPKKPAAKKAAPVDRKSAKGFRVNEFVVYPAHGVGQITEITEQEIADILLDLFVVNFAKEKMILRVPVEKATSAGMRKLADKTIMAGAMKTLRGRARIKRTMWSRRAQEYEAKINSGDLIAIAEVVRDLYRNETQPEQSYSERQLYEAALDRMAREVAAVNKTDEETAIASLEATLSKTTSKSADPKDDEVGEES